MESRKETKVGGKQVTLLGPRLTTGTKAPDFTLLDNSLNPKSLKDFAGKKLLISVALSLDTSVCDAQARRFNEAASAFGSDVAVLTVTMDLPYTQKRWCGAAGVERVITLSDHRDASFGKAYGILMEELRLLNRSIFIVDTAGIIRYIEILQENGNQPDYDKALSALKSL
ncbi:MAG: thiol peroxidase [Spirochaetales bacterium]|nr:MAG: thiol peroxidase [Spirochaetales bacterium]